MRACGCAGASEVEESGSYGGLGRRRAQGRVVRAIGGGREARKVAK